jgi:hypothetical protein
MRLQLPLAVCGFGLFLVLPGLSRADTIYDYNSARINSSVSWSFEVSSILTTETGIPASSLLSSSLGGFFVTNGCSITSLVIEPSNTGISTEPTGVLTTNLTCSLQPGLTGFVESSLTPFTTFGAYQLSQGGTLVIRTTPEPSSLFFLGLALISLASALKLRGFARSLPAS